MGTANPTGATDQAVTFNDNRSEMGNFYHGTGLAM